MIKIKIGRRCRYNCGKLHLHVAGSDGSVNSIFECRNQGDVLNADVFSRTLVREQGFRSEEFARVKAARRYAASKIEGKEILYFCWDVPDSILAMVTA